MKRTIFRPGSRRPARPTRLIGPAVLLSLAVVLLAGCGGSADPAAEATGQVGQGGTADGGRIGPGGPAPGASGMIAEATKGTLQVQSSESQTTVTYTAKTRFTQTVTAKVAVGDCVTVVGSPVAGSTTAITATSVRITAAGSGGTCSFQPDRPGGGDVARGSGAPPSGTASRRVMPSGTPPSGAPGGDRRDFVVATGKVTSVAGSTVVISGTLRSGASAGRVSPSTTPSTTPSATASATPAAGPVTVTLGANVAVTKTVAATSAAAVVGKCAAAFGTADSTGTVAATSITVSRPGANGCTARFGGPGGGSGG